MVEEEHVIQTDLFVYTRFYYTVEEEHAIQTNLFVTARNEVGARLYFHRRL